MAGRVMLVVSGRNSNWSSPRQCLPVPGEGATGGRTYWNSGRNAAAGRGHMTSTPGDRRNRVLAALADGGPDSWSSARLCTVCPRIVGVDGAGVMLMSGDVPRGSLCSTNTVSHLIEELQFTLGEGPCVDAYTRDQVVFEPNLADPETTRWPAFTPPAVDAGVRAVFGFPMRVGTVRLGALNLYRARASSLTDDQHAAALVIAEVAARWVLESQAGASPDDISTELEIGADFRFAVHNAAGIISVQQAISVTEALIRLRAYAFANNRLISDVAQDVISRTLRLE